MFKKKININSIMGSCNIKKYEDNKVYLIVIDFNK